MTTTTAQKTALAGAGAIALGSFLPWAQVFGVSVSGLNGDGVITLVMSLVIAGLALVHRWRWVIVALGVVVVAIGFMDMTAFAAIGLYVTICGGFVAIAGGALGRRPEDPPDAVVA